MKTGLMLIDIQNDYFPGGKMELVGIEAGSMKAKELLELFRKNNLPTFHIQHESLGKGAGFFLPDTEGAEIHESVKPLPTDSVIQKHFPNSFRDTDLLEKLKSSDVTALVICGAMSHMCIDATTRAAADYGFKCTVIHDACATRDLQFGDTVVPAEQVHASFMAALGFAYAKVTSLKKFLSTFQTGEKL
jgi:nicotinamidase-related amidase